MRRIFAVVLAITASVFFMAGEVFATHQLITDFDGGGAWVVNTWGGAGGGDAVGGGEVVNTVNHAPGTGNSFHISYSGADSAGEYGGGVITDFVAVNVSTFNALSFWIYTSSQNLNIGIQIQDAVANGDDMGRVKLTDYLSTGTSVWQNVIIPLAAFKRANQSLDFIIREIKWMAEYDQGHQPSASFYVDDISIITTLHAPVRTRTYSGSDIWVANTADAPGDTLMVWDLATSSVTSNLVDVVVSTGFSIGWASVPANKYTTPGTTAYFSYQIRNMGNAADDVTFSSAVVVGSTWPMVMYWDRDKSGTYTSGDVAYDKAVNLLPDGTGYFLVGVLVPLTASLGQETTVQITAKDNFGNGSNDSWPTVGDDDTLTDSFALSASGAIMSLMKSTSTAIARPGDTTVTVTLTYANNGNAAADNLYITEALPFNTYLIADPGAGNADTLEYYVGSAWQGVYDASATKLRWKDNSVASGGGTQAVSYQIRVK